MSSSRLKTLFIASLSLGIGLYCATVGGHEWMEDGWYYRQSRLKGTDIITSEDIVQGHEMNRNRQIAGWVLTAFGIWSFYSLWRKRSDSPPLALSQTVPEYPHQLKIQGIKGEALIEFVVAADGTISDPRVVQASHPDFGHAALIAIKLWSFKPAMMDHRPVSAKMRVPISFNP